MRLTIFLFVFFLPISSQITGNYLNNFIAKEIKNNKKIIFGLRIQGFEQIITDVYSPYRIGATITYSLIKTEINKEHYIISDTTAPLCLETVGIIIDGRQYRLLHWKSGKGLLISEKFNTVTILGFSPIKIGDTIYPYDKSIILFSDKNLKTKTNNFAYKGEPLVVMAKSNYALKIRKNKTIGWTHLSRISLNN